MKLRISPIALLTALLSAQPQPYPFQDPKLPAQQRIDKIVSLMTLNEKIACLGTNPSVPRLGIKATGHSEGLHGLALGGPGGVEGYEARAMTVKAEDLAYRDEQRNQWVVEEDQVKFMVGPSSATAKLEKTIEVK